MRSQWLAAGTLLTALLTAAHAQAPAPTTPDALVAAAKRAAGQDYAGTFLRVCVAPENLGGGPPRPAAGAAPAVRACESRCSACTVFACTARRSTSMRRSSRPRAIAWS